MKQFCQTDYSISELDLYSCQDLFYGFIFSRLVWLKTPTIIL